MSSWASQAHTYHQPVCHRLSWLHHWSVPRVHTSGAFSSSGWGPDPQCQAVQVTNWTWWWQSCGLTLQIYLIIGLSFRCRLWRLGFVNGQVSLAWSIALRTQELYTRQRVLKERWRELVAAPWNSSRQSSHVLWLKIYSHRLLRACLLGSKIKLPPPSCQVLLGLPSVVCRSRGMLFPCTLYICNQVYLTSA